MDRSDPAELSSTSDRETALDDRRFAHNVLASWAGYLVLVVSGFIIPRFISDHVGQERLGVWDFGWSFVAYLGLLTFGITSSVNRYVAKYSAEGREDLLNSTLSSCMLIFSCAGILAMLVSFGMSAALPYLFGISLAQHLDEARWVLLILGASASIGMPLSVFEGIITGRLRYGLVNLIMGGCQILMLISMILVLLFGGGLISLSLVVLGVALIRGVLRAVAARHVCKDLRISLRLVTRPALGNVVSFGGRQFLRTMSCAFLYQTNNVLIVCFLGPAALAVYARSIGLVSRGQRFIQQYGRVVTPTASDVQAREGNKSLGLLLNRTNRHSLFMALPLVLLLVILGGPLLRVWMGEGYGHGLILAVLAVGHLASLVQYGTVCLLTGLNKHGRPAVAVLVAAVCSVVASAILAGPLKMGVLGIAISVGACLTVAYGIVVPIIAVRAVGVSMGRYVRSVLPRPLIANIPFAIALLLARLIGGDSALTSLGVGLLLGGATLGVTYWTTVLPSSLRSRIIARCVRWRTTSRRHRMGTAEAESTLSRQAPQ